MGLPTHWRLKSQRYHLTGQVCRRCGCKLFPLRGVCPACGREPYKPRLPEDQEDLAPFATATAQLELEKAYPVTD